MECLTPPITTVPIEEWYCPGCTQNNRTVTVLIFNKKRHAVNYSYNLIDNFITHIKEFF